MELDDLLRAKLGDAAAAFYDDAVRDVSEHGGKAAAVRLPALPRRVGKDILGGGRRRLEASGALVDLDAWRLCDAAAFGLLQGAGADRDLLADLFAHGDFEERVMVMRTVAALPTSAATTDLLGEAQRTNTVPHFEAMVCESDLLARAADSAPGFDLDQLNRAVLKAAFIDLPLARMLDVERHANPELSRMLQDLATEREAATRKVWSDTAHLIARAPVPGTVGRLLGDLEHGDDDRRLAAAQAFPHLNRPDLRSFVEERLPREPRPAIRAALQAALT